MLRSCCWLLALSLLLGRFSAQAQTAAAPAKAPLYETGFLTAGQPGGHWRYLDGRGHLELEYDYTSGRLVSAQPDTMQYLLRLQEQWVRRQPATPPRLLGSRAKLAHALQTQLRYPLAAIQAGQQGMVVLTFVADSRGQATDFAVAQAPTDELGAEALRVATAAATPLHWLPAVVDGQPVASRQHLVILFELHDQSGSGQRETIRQEKKLPRWYRNFSTIVLTAEGHAPAAAARPSAGPGPAPVFERGQRNAAGQPVGLWEYLDSKGEVEVRMDYDSARLHYLRPDTARYWLWVDNQWQLKHPSRIPHLLGSTDKRLSDLAKTIKYPSGAMQSQLQGTVVLSYTVTATGQTTDFTIESSMSPECDQEVFRRLRDLPERWIPAIYRGRPTNARFYLSVQFKVLPEEELKRLNAQFEAARKSGTPPPPVQSIFQRTPYAHEIVEYLVLIERNGR